MNRSIKKEHDKAKNDGANALPADREPDGTGDSWMSREERDALMREIDALTQDNRKTLSQGSFAYTPQRHGWVFPLLVNALGIILVSAGILVLIFAFNTRENRIIESVALGLGVQDRYFDAIRKESADKIAGKDREISAIKKNIASLEAEKKDLESKTDARIGRMKTDLLKNNEETLARERSALTAAGDVRAELARQEEERRRRDPALRVQYRTKADGLDDERAAAAGQWERWRRENEQEQLAGERILSAYGRIRNDLEDKRYAGAESGLDALKNYMNEPDVSAVPGVRKRRAVDLFMIDALERLVAHEKNSAGAAPAPAQKNTDSLPPRAGEYTPSVERENLTAVIAEFKNYTKKTRAAAGLSRDKLRKLLEAKLMVKELLSSDPIRTQYPALYNNLEEYFGSYQREYRLEGEAAALNGMITVLAGIKEGGKKTALTAIWARYSGQAQRDLLTRFFDALLKTLP